MPHLLLSHTGNVSPKDSPQCYTHFYDEGGACGGSPSLPAAGALSPVCPHRGSSPSSPVFPVALNASKSHGSLNNPEGHRESAATDWRGGMQNGGRVEGDKCKSTTRKKEESRLPQVGAKGGVEGGVGVLGSPFGAILSNSPFGARRRLTLDGEDGCGGSGARLISIAQLSEPPRSPSKVKKSVEREFRVEGVGG